MVAEGILSLIVLPILRNGQPIACLNLASKHQDQLDPVAVAGMQTLARQFGLALQHHLDAEETLHQRDNLEHLFAALDDYLFVLDMQGNVIHCNRAVEQGLGYGRRLIGQSIALVHPAEVRDEAMRIVGDMLAGKRKSCPLPINKADGSRIMVDTRIVRGNWNGQPALIGISRDITEQNAQRQALELEKQFSEDTLNALPGVFYMFDAAGRFVRWNHQFSQVTGYSDAELATMQGPDFFVGDDKRRVGEAMQRVFVEGQADVEADFQTEDGRLLPYHFKGQRSSIGGQTYLLGVGIDISERRRTQQALETERAHLATLVNTIPDLIWLKDVDGAYLACNPEFERFFGAAERDILGMTDYDFMSGDQAELFREHDRAAMAAGKPTRNEEWITYASDGRRVLLETTKMPMRTPDGRLVGVLGIGHDITASRQLERSLAIREGQLRATLEVNPSVAVQWYDEEARVIYWNPASTLLFGWRAEEAMGKTLDQLIYTDEEAANFRNLLEQIKSEGKPFCHYEAPVRRSDGRNCWALSSTFAIPAEQGKTIFVCMDVDITARKQAEAELIRHRDDLERLVAERTVELSAAEAANRAKSAFLANMSHELRTPMNAIMGMTDLVLRRSSDPVQIDQLGKVKTASNHLLHVINDILDLSKIEAERLQLEQVDFMLGQVLENLVSLIGQKAMDKDLKLLIRLQDGLPTRRFNGDPTRLGQILLNLAGNALKFTAQGAITLSARLIEDTPDGVLLRWEVADTGIGIDDEALKRLFTAFEQADNSMTRKYGGTGLGLVISQRLVQLMGGEIGVVSTPGQGSAFWFTLRLGNASREADPLAPRVFAQSAAERLQTQFAGARLLLAEDEPVNQEVSRGLLEDVGLVVDVAEDGRQALTLAQQNTYALILMDMQMPNLNGIDATQAIRALPAYAKTPILAMTANAFDEDRQRCLDAGMNDHIAKPVDPDKLYETLLAWLERPENRPGSLQRNDP
jgi:PAS domain S-box-containing protein